VRILRGDTKDNKYPGIVPSQTKKNERNFSTNLRHMKVNMSLMDKKRGGGGEEKIPNTTTD
jgi:hypothetical protein